jgi:holo-[acyl-carrier protein] synthase
MRVIGLGTHIIECLRIAQLIERHGEAFILRVFTAEEVQYCSERKAATQHYAGRWAAKEATLKALGTGWSRGMSWRDIEVAVDASGEMRLLLHGSIRELAERLGASDVKISIAHCRTHATATALAMGE